MSRVFGRSYDVYQISKLLQEEPIKKFKRDNSLSSWGEIGEAPEKIEMYLPDEAVDFLLREKIKIMKNPFMKYTLTQVPDNASESRFVKFPSLLPREEFKRELLFYVGMLLSDYRKDSKNEENGIENEYMDVIPLILEYLILKEENKEDRFSIKHLNQLRSFNRDYPKFYDSYTEFDELRRDSEFANLEKTKLEKFRRLCQEREDEIIKLTKESISELSSFEGALGVIETAKTKEDFKEIIRLLMLNERGNRGVELYNLGIESYGYKRLRKEISKCKK
jgi:hypothetical protein